ncbi:hypothetical protein [Hydrogenimonas sp.]
MAKPLDFGAAFRPAFLILLLLSLPFHLEASIDLVLANAGVMPEKEVKKIEEMGNELYERTGVPVYVAVVGDLNDTRPVDLIETIRKEHPTYILLYFSLKPPAVNIFASDDARKLVDIDQILSPLPWRGTIRPIMSPAFSKDEGVKQEVAVFNGYADIVDQVAESKGVKLQSSIGSGGRTTFQWIRTLFYAIFAIVIVQFIVTARRRRVKS